MYEDGSGLHGVGAHSGGGGVSGANGYNIDGLNVSASIGNRMLKNNLFLETVDSYNGLMLRGSENLSHTNGKLFINSYSFITVIEPNIKNVIPKVFKFTGATLGIVSGAITVTDALYNSQINASHILDATITGVSFIPIFGWAIGGGYFVGNMIHQGVYGYSIGDRLDNAVGVPVYNWDW